MGFEKVGRFIAAAGGDSAAIGFLFGLLEEITQGDVYLAIKEDRPLIVEQLLGKKLDQVRDEEWEEFKEGADLANIDLSYERIVREFQTHRLDLLGVILSHPKGRDWLRGQVDLMKEKLGS